MKILFVHDHLGALGGAESNLLAVAAELRRRGHELALLHGPGTGKDEAAWHDIFSDTFPVAELSSVGRALVQFRPAMVFMHNSPGVDTTAALVASGLPVVRMVHDHHLFCLRGCRYPTWSRQPCTRALSPLCLVPCGGVIQRSPEGGWSLAFGAYLRKKGELELHKSFARLVVASDYMRAELERNGFRPDQIEIHSPVPPVAPDAAVAPSAAGQRPRIVFAGQIVRGKGVDVLLESLARVTAPFECVILGDGHHRPYCEELSRQLGLTDRVRFTGYVPAAEIGAYYASATLAVFSSVWPEPFGLSGLEALRHGLPVVAFDVGGVREWLDDGVNGLLAPWMDRAAFAAQVEKLLLDPALARRLGAQGRALAAGRFDFVRYVDGLENLFGALDPAAPVEVLG
jgi:glycosyltransferase involved in cell wall biosynthesis